MAKKTAASGTPPFRLLRSDGDRFVPISSQRARRRTRYAVAKAPTPNSSIEAGSGTGLVWQLLVHDVNGVPPGENKETTLPFASMTKPRMLPLVGFPMPAENVVENVQL